MEYCRECFDEYPPAMLSLLVDKKLNLKNDIIASLLFLEQKGHIIKKNGMYFPVKLVENLPGHLVYIINNLYKLPQLFKVSDKVGFYIINNVNLNLDPSYYDMFYKEIKNDLIKYGLATTADLCLFKENKLFKFAYETKSVTYIFILALILFSVLSVFCLTELYTFKLFFFIFQLGSFLLIISIIALINAINSNRATIELYHDWQRSQKGLEISKQLRGLKRYLIEFTSMADKEIKEIKFWNSYLLCALIFELKGLLSEDVERKYQDIGTNYSVNRLSISTKIILVVMMVVMTFGLIVGLIGILPT